MDPIVSLQGRTIVVTGAGQGIGKGIVELAIELGANVVAVDLNGQTLDAAVSPLPQARVLAVQGSVADPAVADRAVTEAVAKFGAVHGLVNNAGIIRPAMIDKMTDQQWQEVIDVHLTGSFYWMRATGRHMVERSKGGERTGGSIVNISSDAGRKGSIGQINYAAAKAGMLANILMTGTMIAVLVLADRVLLGLFLPNGSPALEVARHANHIAVGSFLFFGVTFVLSGVVRSTGAVMPPLIILTIAMWGIRVPVAKGLQGWLGADAIWWSFPISSLCSALMILAYYRWGNWRKARMLPSAAAAQTQAAEGSQSM